MAKWSSHSYNETKFNSTNLTHMAKSRTSKVDGMYGKQLCKKRFMTLFESNKNLENTSVKLYSRSGQRRCYIKAIHKNVATFTGKQFCWSLFLIKLLAWRFVSQIPTLLFSCECCEIFKNTVLKSICKRLLLYTPNILLQTKPFG